MTGQPAVTGQPAAPARRGTPAGWVLVAPAATLSALVVGVGLGAVALTSIGLVPLFGEASLSGAAWSRAGPDLHTATVQSLVMAGSATLISVVVGVGSALVAVQSARARPVLGGLAAAVVSVPHLVGAASVGLLLSGSGLVPRVLGVAPGDWPELVGGAWPVAVVLELAWKESAFVAIVVVAALGGRHAELVEAATLLGAGPAYRLRRVTLPLMAPAIAASAVIVFLFSVGNYEVAWLLGQAYPEPLPVMSYRLFTSIDLAARPEAAAAATAGVLLSMVAAALVVPLVARLGAAR